MFYMVWPGIYCRGSHCPTRRRNFSGTGRNLFQNSTSVPFAWNWSQCTYRRVWDKTESPPWFAHHWRCPTFPLANFSTRVALKTWCWKDGLRNQKMSVCAFLFTFSSFSVFFWRRKRHPSPRQRVLCAICFSVYFGVLSIKTFEAHLAVKWLYVFTLKCVLNFSIKSCAFLFTFVCCQLLNKNPPRRQRSAQSAAVAFPPPSTCPCWSSGWPPQTSADRASPATASGSRIRRLTSPEHKFTFVKYTKYQTSSGITATIL